jgi:hypothetical protein
LKIAFTGSHGTGKTTSAFELCHKMKIEYPDKNIGIFYDISRFAPKINKQGTTESQLWIFCYKIQEEISMSNRYDILICDRSIFDNIAYSYYLGFNDLAERSLEIARTYFASSYDQIIFKSIKNNDYLIENKIRDSKDLEYRQQVEDILISIYTRIGFVTSTKFKFT